MSPDMESAPARLWSRDSWGAVRCRRAPSMPWDRRESAFQTVSDKEKELSRCRRRIRPFLEWQARRRCSPR